MESTEKHEYTITKQTKEFLKFLNVKETNPDVQAILKLTDKSPHYQEFLIKCRFGNEQVPLDNIVETFTMMRNKNIRVTKSVDQYRKYVVRREFTHNFVDYETKSVTPKTFATREVISKQVYKLLPDEVSEKFIIISTNFEVFSDEVRDANIKIVGNKVMQELPAVVKKVIEGLTDAEKKDLFFNFATLYDNNFKYLVVNNFKDGDKEFKRLDKITPDEFKELSAKGKENVVETFESPYEGFIDKSSKYKTKEILFQYLNASLATINGSEEYKQIISSIEKTKGSFLEGVSGGIVVASALSSAAYTAIGGNKTTHCIANSGGNYHFNSYVRFGYKQYLVTNTDLPPTDDNRIIGMTVNNKGDITHAHSKSDKTLMSNIHGILMKWKIAQFIKPMSEEEILDMLYDGINTETIFDHKDRCEIVVSMLDKLDPSKYDKKKLLHFIRHTHKPTEMRKIIKDSIDFDEKPLAETFKYLGESVLNKITDEDQSVNIVKSLVDEYDEQKKLNKDDALMMLLTKIRLVPPQKLVDIITEERFFEYIKEYSDQQIETILNTVPNFYIHIMRDRGVLNASNMSNILKAIYVYETNKNIRQLVLHRLYYKKLFLDIPKETLTLYKDKIYADIQLPDELEENDKISPDVLESMRSIEQYLFDNKLIDKIRPTNKKMDIGEILAKELTLGKSDPNKKRYNIGL